MKNLRPRVWLLPVLGLLGCGPGARVPAETHPPNDPYPPLPEAALKLELVQPPLTAAASPGPVLNALQTECDRAMARFKTVEEPRPYFLGYQVIDKQMSELAASTGAITDDMESTRRTLEVEVRVGSHALDNTNPVGPGVFGARGSWMLPRTDDPEQMRPTIWLATEKRYRQSKEAFAEVKSTMAVKAKEEDESADFSREEPTTLLETPVTITVDRAAWKEKLRRYSALFRPYPEIFSSEVKLQTAVDTRYLVNSEGSKVQTSNGYVRLMILATTRTEDGMDLFRHETIDASTLAGLADEETIKKRIEEVITDLRALKTAPLAEPYVGPAILEGRAAGVFFHEIFGHRVEGHRQKGSREGQTFAKQIGKPVLPEFIDVYDDPTIRSLNGEELNGFYRVDDEAVRAQRALVVEAGLLRGFLMSRSPTRGFNASNGHGRRQEGMPVVSRQGNLVVQPRRATTPEALKERLILEVKRQGKPYGLRFSIVEGGFTNTSRYGAQFFKVQPVMVYKIYPDGREELVRGADIEGTPLTSISTIQASGNDMTTFNGYCGAESGMVPVSASAPSLLVSKVEIARKFSGKEKPPLLPAPPVEQGGAR